jgi:hypothetical protein
MRLCELGLADLAALEQLLKGKGNKPLLDAVEARIMEVIYELRDTQARLDAIPEHLKPISREWGPNDPRAQDFGRWE